MADAPAMGAAAAAPAERRAPVRRGGRRRGALGAALAAGLVVAAACAPWRVQRWCAAIRAPGGGAAVAGAEASPCEALREEVTRSVLRGVEAWERAASRGERLRSFGARATALLERTLGDFDRKAEERGLTRCHREREEIERRLKFQLHAIFLAQRSTIEEALYRQLKKDILRRMRRVGRELPVWEKLRLLHIAMRAYDAQVRDLLPSFVESTERDRAQRRLSYLQWAIHETPEGKELKEKWKAERLKQMSTVRQATGLSVSLSRGLRLMLRPAGLGNLKISARHAVGPPHNPNEVSVGVFNDGSLVDVYKKQSAPPLFKLQPTIGIELSAS